MGAIPRWFILVLGVVALLLWIGNFCAAVFVPHYKPDPTVGYIIMLIAGACFTKAAIKAGAEGRAETDKAQEKERQDYGGSD